MQGLKNGFIAIVCASISLSMYSNNAPRLSISKSALAASAIPIVAVGTEEKYIKLFDAHNVVKYRKALR